MIMSADERALRIAAARVARDQAAFAGSCFLPNCDNPAVAVAEVNNRRPHGVCEDCIPDAENRGYQVRRQGLILEDLLDGALPLSADLMEITGTKKCLQCKERKTVGEFPNRPKKTYLFDARCRACAQANIRAWKAANPERAKASQARLRLRRRLEVLQHYGGLCACCGEKQLEFLAIDHIDGGGGAHRRAIKKRGAGFYNWLLQQGLPEGYRVLCHNCNLAFGFYGYCPHDREQMSRAGTPAMKLPSAGS